MDVGPATLLDKISLPCVIRSEDVCVKALTFEITSEKKSGLFSGLFFRFGFLFFDCLFLPCN